METMFDESRNWRVQYSEKASTDGLLRYVEKKQMETDNFFAFYNVMVLVSPSSNIGYMSANSILIDCDKSISITDRR